MEINIPTGPDILRVIAIPYVNKVLVYITDCNPPLNGGMGNRGMESWGIGESGNRGIGQSWNRGIKEPGNRGIGEAGNLETVETGNQGTKEYGNCGTGESGNPDY